LAVIRVDRNALPAVRSAAVRLREDSDCKPGDLALIPSRANQGSEWHGKVVAVRHAHEGNDTEGTYWPGDRYELTGLGRPVPEPGVPIFDAQGRVFAIETPGDPLHPGGVFAIPIHYGLELLQTPRS
jgi:hypothetical protein